MPVQDGAGRITAFKGKDTFKTGIGVKKGDTTWMLNGSEWSVNWDVPVDATLNGAGKAIESAVDQGPDQGRAGPVTEGLEPQARRGQRVRGLLDRRRSR